MCKIIKHKKSSAICFVICIFIVLTDFAFSQDTNKKNVLILNSYHRGCRWTEGIEDGIVSILKKDKKSYSIQIEYMDTKRINDEEYFKKLYELYKYKFKNSKFDVVISIDNDAFYFLLNYGELLFSNTPTVFCGINNFEDKMLTRKNLFTGIVEEVDIKSTIDIALKLHKNTKQIFIIVDKSSSGIINKKKIQKLIPYYSNVAFYFLEGRTISNLKKSVKILPRDSIIFYCANCKNNHGGLIPNKKCVKIISENCNVPIYSAWDTYLGHGIVGGKITSAYNQGETATRMTKRILEGEKIESIPIKKENLNQYMFDYNEIKRFGLEISDLPSNSIVINKPSAVYSIKKEIAYNIMILIIMMLIVIVSILIVNILKRKQTEKELKNSEELYRRLIETLPDGMAVYDEDKIEFVNRAAVKIIGAQKESEIIGKCYKDFVHPDEYTDTERNIKNIKEKKADYTTVERKMIRIDGKIIEVEGSTIPLYSGNIVKYLSVGRDVTEQKKAEELQKKINEGIEQDKLKTDFFANLSHELRTPINIIFSSIQLLELDLKDSCIKNDAENTTKRVRVLKQNCYRLLRLVNNLIDITKMDAGYFVLDIDNYNIVSIVEDITMSTKEYIEQKGINLLFDTDIEEKIISCDPDKIERIILNLLSNAIKFTDEKGSIIVNIYDKEESVIITVKDTGIGIPKDKLKVIFERFRQVDKTLRRNHEGSGIGLSLVESLVKMQEGKIRVESEYGKGSIFIIELPANIVGKVEKNISIKSTPQPYEERINIEFSDIYA